MLDQPFRWTEPSTWPWFLYVWLAFFLVGWLKPLWTWLQREQAKSWPTASGRIESATLAEPKRFLGLTLQPDRSRGHVAVLAYSYSLSGNTFQGEYRRTFGSDAEVQNFLRDLQGMPVTVQHNPSKPARSLLLESTVETLLRNRPPSPNFGDAAWVEPLPNWLKPLIGIFAFLSLAGFILSLWVHIGALFGRNVAPEYLFFAMHIGIFVVFIPAIFVTQKRVGSTNRKDFWKVVTKGSPDGIRYLFYLLLAYSFVSSLLYFFQSPPGVAPKGLGPGTPWRVFSEVWMVFYFGSFVMLSSALHSSRERP